MKKSIIALLLITPTYALASDTIDSNYKVAYDCGFVSGFELMGARPELDDIDKIFFPDTTVTIGKTQLTNPTYDIQISHTNEKSEVCTVAGAGEATGFHWYLRKGDCTKIVKHPLNTDKITQCGISVQVSN
ncbi:hypothetical protein CGG80_23710 [Vibrio parahaemolyticus]|uniref:hypothetical protein n=1 Tax=Vibrio parahaemolyticus TaxID=670 RepID=UPI00112364F9|nr:hypothetical protein [Vibrio parahaemolyticus]EGQ7858298.1 hypothetical protein [Vibrio parahaemolyticus]MDF4871464.1 hypothetical protein [Vibrio parahaemolyticus]TOF18362.1 hypothetical protein CGJ26_23555 [Vibrio parahaemolyticus]TOQ03318.1 hypothetical protein CGH03_21975 [Vibrio parahaemolyticus]TOR11727.1 hypothetical protein CGG80_23710 [Vibrio parahaemolyticus]